MRALRPVIFSVLLTAGLVPGSSAAGKDSLFQAARAFAEAYPNSGLTALRGKDGYYLATVEEGPRFLFAPFSGCPAVPPDAREDPPLCATVAQTYPAGPGGRHPEAGFEPGRVRHEAFFKYLYGNDAREVEHQLVPVDFLGETWRVSSRHGAANALKRVAAALEKAVAADPGLTAYILPGGGTYAWRKILAAERLSAHSFGIAIDLNVEKGVYWQWNPAPETVEEARRNYPQAIVDAFESEGFVWGGKWRSFDFMHFEYRPELFPQDRQAPLQPPKMPPPFLHSPARE